jgi:hypothetical protein
MQTTMLMATREKLAASGPAMDNPHRSNIVRVLPMRTEPISDHP